MKNGDRFIQKFNELDEYLLRITGLNRSVPFVTVVNSASERHSFVRRRKEILKSIGNLRNAIVHDRHYPNKIIADPRDEVIEELEAVLNAIKKPQKLIPKFQKNIKIFTSNDSLADCLSFMIEKDFSQIVVAYKNEYVLLTYEGIAKWLKNAGKVGLSDFKKVSVSEAICCEDKNICKYMSRNDTVDAALEMFEKAIDSGIPRLQAILITENGNKQEQPLGIVTPWDLLGEVQ